MPFKVILTRRIFSLTYRFIVLISFAHGAAHKTHANDGRSV